MKPLRLCLFCALLAVVGYFVGARLRGNSVPGGIRVSSSETTPSAHPENTNSPENGALRDPRTGATFAESQKYLKELIHEISDFDFSRLALDKQRHTTGWLEIERVFSLATKEEMLDFFAKEDFSVYDEEAFVILPAAYARLASMAPEEAAAIWTDRYRNDGMRAGVDGLVCSWAMQDPAAAEEWVDALPESTRTRDLALLGLLEGTLDTAPGLVMRRFTEVGDRQFSTEFTTRLAWTLGPDDFPDFAEQILSVTRKNWEYQNQLSAALEVWAEQDGESMLAWLGEQPVGRVRDSVVRSLARTTLKHGDPAAIARKLGPSLAENEPFAQLAGQAWMTWLAKGEDTHGALAWLRTHSEHMEFPKRWPREYRDMSAEHVEQVLPMLSAIPDDSTRNALVRSLLERYAFSDPRAAIARAQELLPANSDTTGFISSTVFKLAFRENPGSAVDLALEVLPEGSSRNGRIRNIMDWWAKSHPRDAADRASSLPASMRNEAFSSIASEWAKSAPDQVLDYLKNHRDPDSMRAFAKSSFWQIGYSSGESHLDEALDLPDGKMKREAVQSLIAGWARANLEDSAAALNALESGPVRDGAIERFVIEAARNNRGAALTWSLAIDDPGKRRTTALKQARSWLKADRAKAARWIETADDLPPKWKEQLFKPQQQKKR